MFRMIKRQQAMQKLINCFQQKDTKLKKKVFHIDRSFNHDELNSLGEAEKYIFSKTVGELVQKEKNAFVQQERNQKREKFASMGTKLKQFGRQQDRSKTVYLLNHPKKKQQLRSTEMKVQSKKIFIERKYNTQLSLQLHSIMQAKQIEEARGKMMRQMNSTQQSPLVNELLKLTKNNQHQHQPRQSHRCLKTKPNNYKPISPSKKILHQNNQLFQICQTQNTHLATSNSSPSKYHQYHVSHKNQNILNRIV